MSKTLSEITPIELHGTSNKRTLVVSRPTTTVREALKTMATHNITSLPIYSHDSDKIVTIVNLIDVLNYVIKEAVSDEKLPLYLNSEKSKNLDNQIEVVMTLDNEKESYRIFETDANECLKTGIHRSLVIDYTNNMESYILTQSDIIRYVYEHPECLPSVDFDSSLKSFGLTGKEKNVVLGHDKEIALNVYRRMAENKLTGIPIIDSEDKLVGNLSLSDLRGLSYQSIDCLVLPVLDFLSKIPNRKNSLIPFSLTENSSLQETLKLITDKHIHRVWIVDEEHKVQNVITLTDLITVFLKHLA
ncbi:11151_t:CDS:2 [Diversispora eburnea]|uniref:11151_t:CDS:1 n=1 Tax=Diversispora eburnea TaxID=1213867 RepID=A0A9N8YTI1_9GLOM|nr:11151_t:CDS:2 [Diversispora eburnea]